MEGGNEGMYRGKALEASHMQTRQKWPNGATPYLNSRNQISHSIGG